MDALSGPVDLAAAVLGLGGLAKLIRPIPTAGAMRALHIPAPLTGVRLMGLGEVILGGVAILSGARPALVAIALAYLAFAGFVLAARSAGTAVQSCGCFGTPDTPPSMLHVALNLAFASAAIAGAIAGLSPLGVLLAAQPAAGVAFVLAEVVTVYLAYLVMAVLPLVGAARVVARIGRITMPTVQR